MILAGIAMAGPFAILTAEMIRGVGARTAATAGGATASAQSVMYVLANPAIGWGVARLGGYDAVLLVIAGLVVPGALLWPYLRPRAPV